MANPSRLCRMCVPSWSWKQSIARPPALCGECILRRVDPKMVEVHSGVFCWWWFKWLTAHLLFSPLRVALPSNRPSLFHGGSPCAANSLSLNMITCHNSLQLSKKKQCLWCHLFSRMSASTRIYPPKVCYGEPHYGSLVQLWGDGARERQHLGQLVELVILLPPPTARCIPALLLSEFEDAESSNLTFGRHIWKPTFNKVVRDCVIVDKSARKVAVNIVSFVSKILY